MKEITEDTIIADILTIMPSAVPILRELGMHCMGCAKAKTKTLGQACASHGADVDAVLAKINALV